jgi:hypothetical protein
LGPLAVAARMVAGLALVQERWGALALARVMQPPSASPSRGPGRPTTAMLEPARRGLAAISERRRGSSFGRAPSPAGCASPTSHAAADCGRDRRLLPGDRGDIVHLARRAWSPGGPGRLRRAAPALRGVTAAR